MKKIITVVALSSAVILAFTGCGQKPAVAPTQAAGQPSAGQKAQDGANFNSSEFALLHEVTSLQRLQRSDNPLSKEQIAKLVPILSDIKAKDTIDQAYADTQTKAIEAVLTDAQKTILDARTRLGNNQQQDGQNPNGQQGNANSQNNGGQTNNANGQPSNNGNGQRGNWNGQPPRIGNGQQGMGQGMNLKDVCTRVIDELQNGISQSGQQATQ